MQKENPGYYNDVELDRGVQLTAVSYDQTQRAMVIAGRATVGGKPVIAEISGIATARGEDGTVNMWLPAFRFKGRNGNMNRAPGLNAVATLSPRQGAIETAKAIAACVNKHATAYKATISGTRRKALVNIVFTGKNCVLV
ncbi:MAG: hypothetical protein COX65_04965 [Elusimicrobia bacterium CG_4_10_14_0_2_um_filter_56_8]|nr:MAG: hypothetical protein AUJ51_07815 [Elusimicrobia bacterium CG1_02_56_21]PJA14870.1 MAG: hypothetical protein COX65_04965 [Elusimicrobia bacterium CG_4_10_14_0_2_um_filter_56_8]